MSSTHGSTELAEVQFETGKNACPTIPIDADVGDESPFKIGARFATMDSCYLSHPVLHQTASNSAP